MIYDKLNVYTELFNDFYDYLTKQVEYKINVEKKAPPEQIIFPCVVMKEVINISNDGTTNRQEFSDTLAYQVDIYTKDFIDDNGQHFSIDIQQELKALIFDYFYRKNFRRTAFDNWENNDRLYDRITVIFQGEMQSWNKRIV